MWNFELALFVLSWCFLQFNLLVERRKVLKNHISLILIFLKGILFHTYNLKTLGVEIHYQERDLKLLN